MFNGKMIKVSIFGQSHSPAVGMCIEGLPSGLAIDFDELNVFLRRRAPGNAAYSTQRSEADKPEFLSGLAEGLTCGAPLAAIIRNTDMQSHDYDQIKDIPRPSHSDYPAYIKYGAAWDFRGGGAFSGRLTAPLCIAGGICLQLLKKKGIRIAAQITQIGKVKGRPFDPLNAGEEMNLLKDGVFPALNAEAGRLMLEAIEEARQAGDSLGGIVQCAAVGVSQGIGGPLFEGLENRLASIIFAIPAVKGLEFGNGFDAAGLKGSENNDAFVMCNNTVKTKNNRHGGILGGISSGMPILFRAAFKPTPSIAIEQDSISLSQLKNVKLSIKGRHDPCIVPRAVPVVEAAAAIAIYDAMLENNVSLAGCQDKA